LKKGAAGISFYFQILIFLAHPVLLNLTHTTLKNKSKKADHAVLKTS